VSEPSGCPGGAATGRPAARFELFRDGLGVPHVRAGTEADLAYGQGWVAAVDRG
jgi:acyl-homoserine lactone acylase PvdQ